MSGASSAWQARHTALYDAAYEAGGGDFDLGWEGDDPDAMRFHAVEGLIEDLTEFFDDYYLLDKLPKMTAQEMLIALLTPTARSSYQAGYASATLDAAEGTGVAKSPEYAAFAAAPVPE